MEEDENKIKNKSTSSDLLINTIVDQQLGDDSGQEGGGDAQTKAAPGTVKRPPQAQGQGRKGERQLHIIGKVEFL